ncbi:rhamnulokinase [Glycomyces algeriensis]|uniref:Carbohydrate kinase n=1 Tax=Glycomyces algeriensis TaxID=256037 RepID=A0A9W6GB86_9ACTN|nr:rhamnulokinase family protein [Glycomyces algeriensis]MDA1367340.1 rhamnulokinase [Glycomyces algeriensis]MDR7351007.1 rhamnulokinase [Glycomyces algeriensis]GLI43720.1 carbohydrate kinase [Glycomyces algeriensis]
MTLLAAVDLGATSGRVMAARLRGDRIELAEAARFPNRSVKVRGRLYWDVLGLWSGVLEGLRAVGDAAAIGVDSWAVDYGLIDADGHLVANPVSYRDARGAAAKARVLEHVSAADLFAATGIQPQPFNTVFQLAAETASADRALLIPDLIGYWLSGVRAWEATNASTTGLVDLGTGDWSAGLAGRVGVDLGLLGPVTATGTVLGPVLPEVAEATGLAASTQVVATASHDTAAAVAAVPYEGDRAAYISCGTWSLVGVERDVPVTSAEALEAGFTNERGADGSIRFLRNVAGLWLLNESVNVWRAQGLAVDLGGLLAEAAAVERLRSVVDPDDVRFADPGDMPARIRAYCSETGQPVPETSAEVAACVLDSLALAHRRAVASLEALTGDPVETLHIVGGGANNALLCQLTADATGRTVLAGPDEATALGNALVQAQALGLIAPGAPARRAVARASARPRRYEPRGADAPWGRAVARLQPARVA